MVLFVQAFSLSYVTTVTCPTSQLFQDHAVYLHQNSRKMDQTPAYLCHKKILIGLEYANPNKVQVLSTTQVPCMYKIVISGKHFSILGGHVLLHASIYAPRANTRERDTNER